MYEMGELQTRACGQFIYELNRIEFLITQIRLEQEQVESSLQQPNL